MLPPDALAAVLTVRAGTTSEGVVYRTVDYEALHGFHRQPPFPRPRPLYSLGAPLHGARFTPRGGMAALYAAEDRETALAELDQVATIVRREAPTLARRIPPVVVLSADAHLRTVLDLTDPTVQEALGTDLAELRLPWRRAQRRGAAPTQQLGAAVFASGRFEAIRYPSARLEGGRCLAIFTERLVPPAFVEIYDPHGNLRERIP
jgi:RES domain-containing protein